LFLAFVQLFLKAAIAGYLVIDYKNKNPEDFPKELTNFNYSQNRNQANPRTGGANANVNVNASGNFQNPY